MILPRRAYVCPECSGAVDLSVVDDSTMCLSCVECDNEETLEHDAFSGSEHYVSEALIEMEDEILSEC